MLASGEVLRSGGRCHKNSTGFDLTSLMVGSEGMLGIITEITVRLIPHPQARAMLGASFADFAAAARCGPSHPRLRHAALRTGNHRRLHHGRRA